MQLVTVAADDIGTEQADWPSLQGPHNAQNAAAAIAAVRALELTVRKSLPDGDYPGLEHRMERVRG